MQIFIKFLILFNIMAGKRYVEDFVELFTERHDLEGAYTIFQTHSDDLVARLSSEILLGFWYDLRATGKETQAQEFYNALDGAIKRLQMAKTHGVDANSPANLTTLIEAKSLIDTSRIFRTLGDITLRTKP